VHRQVDFVPQVHDFLHFARALQAVQDDIVHRKRRARLRRCRARGGMAAGGQGGIHDFTP
jgi:hypothetical protein